MGVETGGGLPPLVEPVDELTADERARYSRHLLLDAIGDSAGSGRRRSSSLVRAASGRRC